jgi:hypothetical protein
MAQVHQGDFSPDVMVVLRRGDGSIVALRGFWHSLDVRPVDEPQVYRHFRFPTKYDVALHMTAEATLTAEEVAEYMGGTPAQVDGVRPMLEGP